MQSASSNAVAVAVSPPSRTWWGQPGLVWLCLALVYLVWGSTYLAMRRVVEHVPPFLMSGTRFLLTGGLLYGVLLVRGSPRPTLRQWLNSVPVGLLMFVLGNGTVALAEKSIDSGVAAVVCGTMPLWMAAIGRFYGERTAPREWLALVLGLLGVVALSLGRALQVDLTASAILMLAPIAWAVGSTLNRKLELPTGFMAAAAQMLVGGVLGLFVSMLSGERVPAQVPVSAVAAWLYLCVFGSLVAYSAYLYLLRNARPSLAVSYAYVNPPLAVLFGIALGNETAGREVFIALALVAAATVLVVSKPKTKG